MAKSKVEFVVVAMDQTPNGCICFKRFTDPEEAMTWAKMQRDTYHRDCTIARTVGTLDAKRKGDLTR